MTTTQNIINLPNDEFGGGMVIASVWLRDDVEVPFALLLLLLPEPPYYALAEVEYRDGKWVEYVDRQYFPNIVPAVEAYQQNGGDY